MIRETRSQLIPILLQLVLCSLLANASETTSGASMATFEGVQALCQWVSHGESLVAEMHTDNDNEDNILNIYNITESWKRIGRYDLGGFPYSITLFGGKLIVLCETATGYLVYGFAYSNDSTKMIVDDGSRYPPELFYFGPTDQEAVAVPVLEWVGGKHIRVSANVYLLQGENTVKALNLPWNKRFGLEK